MFRYVRQRPFDLAVSGRELVRLLPEHTGGRARYLKCKPEIAVSGSYLIR